MRVVQLCHDYAGPFRVIARQYATALHPAEVTTIFLRGPHNAELASEIPGEVLFLSLSSSELKGLKGVAVAAVKDAIGAEKPDTIIAHRYKPLFVALQLNKTLGPRRILGVMHEYGFLKRLTRSLYARFWPDNVHLAGVSAPVVDEVAGILPAQRLHVIGHGLESFTCQSAASARLELGIPMGVYCFGIVGRLVTKKNHAVLLEACARVDDAVVAIVGGGELEASLRSQAADLKIEDRVIFTGARDNARQYLSAFDAFVLSSSAKEAFGLVLLEAAEAGLPIICADIPGPRSVLGDDALYFREGDATDLAAKMNQQMSAPVQDTRESITATRAGLQQRFSAQVMHDNILSATGITYA